MEEVVSRFTDLYYIQGKRDFLTFEEQSTMASNLGFHSNKQLHPFLHTLISVFDQAIQQGGMDEGLREGMKGEEEGELIEELLQCVNSVWEKKRDELTTKKKRRRKKKGGGVAGDDYDTLTDLNWSINIPLSSSSSLSSSLSSSSSSSSSSCSLLNKPLVVYDLTLKKSASEELTNLSLKLNKDQLYGLFLQLEEIQAEMDAML